MWVFQSLPHLNSPSSLLTTGHFSLSLLAILKRISFPQVIEITEYRTQLYDYLKNRMMAIAPNLTVMVGDLVGARLISHAGTSLRRSFLKAIRAVMITTLRHFPEYD